jgi:hypothetical protein
MSTIVWAALIGLGVMFIGAGLFGSASGGGPLPDQGEDPSSKDRASHRASHPAGDPVGDPEGEEHQAAAASEAIEELVNLNLAKIPGLAGTHIDFGSAADGSLEIWIGDQRYTSVDEIPDPRIQQAVREAVASFNE